MLEKPDLFASRREFVIVMGVLALIVLLRLGWEYRSYRQFASQPFVYTHAVILNLYPKERNGKHYTILKLRTDTGRTLYTTAWRNDLARGDRLYLQLIPGERVGFWDLLKGTYLKSRIKRAEHPPPTVHNRLEAWVAHQHEDAKIASLYNALFWATPIDRSLREPIAALGVSHLVALSGFHLGILWGVLYGVLAWLYRPWHARRFPYRYLLRDVGAVTMVLLAGYVVFVGAPPSLVRSYAMLLAGWLLVLAGLAVVRFSFLAVVALGLLALFPSLLLSLGFWLSVAGVFYIFLLLHYCQDRNKWLVGLVCVPVGIFVLMQPLVHGLFGMTSHWQLLSPMLSLGFTLFYPLALVLHLVGLGGALDGMLNVLLDTPHHTWESLLPLWAVGGYVALSLAAIRWRWAFYLLLAVAAGYVGWGMLGDG